MLSANEELLWATEMSPSSAGAFLECPLNLVVAARIAGAIDVDALERSLSEIMRRHAVLRSRFTEIDGCAIRRIEPHADRMLELEQASAASTTGGDDELAASIVDSPLSATSFPLVRSRLLRLDDHEHLLAIALHHLVFDNWSRRVFTRELRSLYESYSAGRPSSLPELTVQYPDYVTWHRERLAAGRLASAAAYWNRRMAGAPDLRFGSDAPRAASTPSATCRLGLAADRVAALRAMCKRRAMTPALMLMAAFAAVLRWESGSTDVSFGVPISDRGRTDFEALIGLFAGVVVVRTTTRPRAPFSELLTAVRDAFYDACRYKDVPYALFASSARASERVPPIRALFNFVPAGSGEDVQLSVLDTKPIRVAARRQALADVSLHIIDNGPTFECGLVHHPDLWPRERAQTLLGHLDALLGSAVADIDGRLDEDLRSGRSTA